MKSATPNLIVRLGSAAALLLALALTTSSAHASTITVTTTDDELRTDGDCSLREAITAANTDLAFDACPAGSGADTITLSAATYVIAVPVGAVTDENSGDLDIFNDVTIKGAGQPSTTIDAAGVDRAFQISEGTVTLSKMTITGGIVGAGDGGGLLVAGYGHLKLVDVRVTANSGSRGGGLYMDYGATATLLRTRVDNNTAGYGGGIYSLLGELTVRDSHVDHNLATENGGGILANGTVLIESSTINGNVANENAGAILGGASSQVDIVTSTLNGNTAGSNGGGVYSIGAVGLYNVTLTDNTADSDNDGIGDGGGFFVVSGWTLSAQNTIIAGNVDASTTGVDQDECSGTLTSAGYNLIEGPNIGCSIVGSPRGNLIGVSLNLGPLQNNGGPTKTRALLPGSPAIDAGSHLMNVCAGPDGSALDVDQRGYVHNGICDIGAFEYLSAGTPTPWPSVTYDDTDPAIAYDANWLGFVEPLDYGGSFHYTGTAGSTASFNFDGTRLTLVFNKVLDRGVMNVAIDGVQVAAIDQFDPGILYQQQWTSGVLSPGAHSLLLTHGGNGTFVDLDAIIVTP